MLVAPYLPRLFGRAGYLNETGQDFVNDNARERAIFLIQYLVTQDNDREYSEKDLFLNQLLVNYDDSLPLTKCIKLGSVESIGSTHSTFVMAEIKNTHNISF